MKRAIIFANGEMDNPPEIIKHLQPEDLIIAADGGSRHCKILGITPSVIIGDFDSLDEHQLASYTQAGVVIRQYPSHKNETDLELALYYAMQQECLEVYILGALGARWDMTVANILLLAHPAFSSMRIHLLEGPQELILLRGNGTYEIHGRPGDSLSLIPLAGDAKGITTRGLEYPLKDETLAFGSSRGVSNVFIDDHVQINVGDGILLCFANWQKR